MASTDYSSKADDYAAFRPPYANEAFDTLSAVTGLKSSWVVADIGAGTGNVTRHLVHRVNRVFAVEPADAMRSHVARLLESHPGSAAIAATAEATTLPDQCADLITVGQAIHWFERASALREFGRILKPGGWLALIWNQFEQAIVPDLTGLFAGDTEQRFHFPTTIHENWMQFIGGMRSSAFHPSPGDQEYAQFEQQQREAFDRQAVNGLITVSFSTELAVGRLPRATQA